MSLNTVKGRLIGLLFLKNMKFFPIFATGIVFENLLQNYY